VNPEPLIRTAAERAAAEVYETVRAAALEAARLAVTQALAELTGADLDPGTVSVEDRVTRSEAAERLGVTPQTIMRMEKKGVVRAEKVGHSVYVSLSEVRAALRAGLNVSARARVGRMAGS